MRTTTAVTLLSVFVLSVLAVGATGVLAQDGGGYGGESAVSAAGAPVGFGESAPLTPEALSTTAGAPGTLEDTVVAGTELSSAVEGFRSRAVYVWGYAGVLATDDAAATRFFERTEELGIETVFLSWGASTAVSAQERAGFVADAHANGLQVHALVGTAGSDAVTNAAATIPDILTYNENRSTSERFDGVHLDVEPGTADLGTFLGEYRTLLDGIRTEIQADGGATIDSQALALSAAIGWWWPNSHPTETEQLVDAPALDYVVVMAYWDTEREVRDRLSNVVSRTETPYVLAAETQEFTDGGDERVTFYEEGPVATNRTLQNVSETPPSPGHIGGAFHFYQSSVSTWDTLREVTPNATRVTAGETVTVETTVLFDDNFPTASHESRLLVRFEGPNATYTTTTTTAPPSRQPTTVPVEWTVPADIEGGSYRVTATLRDTTVENDSRQPIRTRSTPVTLDRLEADSLTVTPPPALGPAAEIRVGGARVDTMLAGTNGNVLVEVTNRATSTTAYELDLAFETPDGSTLGAFETVDSSELAPGASETVRFEDVTGGLTAVGFYDVVVSTADSGGRLEQTGALAVSPDVDGNGQPAAEATAGPDRFDGMLDSVSGQRNDAVDIVDVVALFENLDRPVIQNNAELFRFGAPDDPDPERVGIADVVALFRAV